MIELALLAPDNPLRVLAIGAHADDIEIGCGGTILMLAARYPALGVRWVVFSAEGPGGAEAGAGADAFLEGVSDRRVVFGEFRDGFLPYSEPAQGDFEGLKDRRPPDLIFTHQRHDLHQDHRMVSRAHVEHVPRPPDLGVRDPEVRRGPRGSGLFVHLPEAVARRKAEALLAAYGSQRTKRWFTEDTFMAIMRLRGMESNAPSGYAEAFYSRKSVIGCGEGGGAEK